MSGHQAGKTVLIGLDACVPELVERFSREGALPNIRRFMEEGVFGRANYVFPGITPVNWATVATGAYPGTHGITDFLVHLPGEPLDRSESGFLTTHLQAETLWEAASRAGKKVATLNFPGTWPLRVDDAIWVAGEGSPATGSRFQLKSSSCYVAGRKAEGTRDSIKLKMQPASNRENTRDLSGFLEAELELTLDNSPGGSGPSFRLLVKPGEVIIASPKHAGGGGVTLEVGDWSPWLTGEFKVSGRIRTGTFRFKLIANHLENGDFRLYCSQVMPTDGVTHPEDLATELTEVIGPMIENCGTRGYERGWIDAGTLLEEAEYKGLWLCRAANYLLDTYGCDLVGLKWHFLDHVQHTFWGGFDPVSPWYRAECASEFTDVIRKAYIIADRMIGEFLSRLGNGQTNIVVVSDHGHIPHLKAASINNLLARHGLIRWQPTGGKPRIDWTETRAYASPCIGHIYVNLRGREPHGIVEPGEEYERVRDRIIDLLYDLKDPSDDERPVALAIRREEAAVFGLWGPRAGDIVYFMNPGFTGDNNWFPLTEDGELIRHMGSNEPVLANYGEYKYIAPKFKSTHGCGLPTVKLGEGSEQAVFMAAGPRLRSNYRRRKPLCLTDVAPTVALMSDTPIPRNAEGAVLWDIFDEESDVVGRRVLENLKGGGVRQRKEDEGDKGAKV
ncbi:MAG: alkaline phosphatase family protein [Bacillota bacterium]